MVDDAEVGVFFVLPVRANNSAAAAMPAPIRYPAVPGPRPLTPAVGSCPQEQRTVEFQRRHSGKRLPSHLRATYRLC